ncbi:uncharacterized protein LOC129582644 isoform X2 [Paramacrobiotus metropolitanus]|nr:uncharacterized protein LOC129582644 isoform X2 [Paramacrobiotus metropolitanus]XP_055330185.1 uncharacterized protein LOC129582644 isoform X2 [Paramacrobiotus metropolitanus]
MLSLTCAESFAEIDEMLEMPSPLQVTPPPAKNPGASRSGKKAGRGGVMCIVKGNWSAEEDRRLAQLVEQYLNDAANATTRQERRGLSTRWSEIAKELPGRVGKQCRERWHNHLRPDINKGRWSFSEEIIIFVCWKHWGSQWARIARLLKSRSDNRVKNHWNCHMKRRLQRDQPYYDFMMQGYAYLSTVYVPPEGEEEADDDCFQQALVPHVTQYLKDHSDELEQIPFFTPCNRKERGSFRSVSSPDLLSDYHAPPLHEHKKPVKKTKKTKKRHCPPPATTGVSMVQQRTWQEPVEQQWEFDEENQFLHNVHAVYTQPMAHQPAGGMEPYIKVEHDMAGLASPMHPMEYQYHDGNPFYYSPYRPLDLEPGTIGEEMLRTLNNSCDPLLSKAAMGDFHCSPRYTQRAVTSTPLKQTSTFNVPMSECGYSPLSGGGRLLTSHDDPASFMSPVRRCYSHVSSTLNETSLWTPVKDNLPEYRAEETMMFSPPVKLSSIVTPQPIREALARGDSSRRTLSPEELESPNRLFSDASELIDGEMNLSQCSQLSANYKGRVQSHSILQTPDNALSKCRRRLTDQWGTPSSAVSGGSFASSGYGSFHMTPL